MFLLRLSLQLLATVNSTYLRVTAWFLETLARALQTLRNATVLKLQSDLWLLGWILLGDVSLKRDWRSRKRYFLSLLAFFGKKNSVTELELYYCLLRGRRLYYAVFSIKIKDTDYAYFAAVLDARWQDEDNFFRRVNTWRIAYLGYLPPTSLALDGRFTGGPASQKLRLNFLLDLGIYLTHIINRSFSFGFLYIQGFVLLLFIDACLTDDEPLWEPIEWSLVQSWILVIFVFAWIAENLIVSRYGSYTGRDKRVWFAWYKTFWLVEGYYVFNYGVVCVLVIVPFYYETNYNLSFVYSWWHWYSRVFFFKFISIYTLVLLVAYFLQSNVRWLGWKKGLVLILLINVFLSYLLYTHFVTTFFAYFTDPTWYQKTRPVDYVQLSHEPARWGWGPAKKDHFTYHGVKTVLWFKNDGPFATSFLLFQTFMFICLFTLYIYWITLFRRVYSSSEIPLTLTTYCVSALKQFFYFFLFFYIFIFFSYISNYARFPIEFLWSLDTISWFQNFTLIIWNYPHFLISIFLN